MDRNSYIGLGLIFLLLLGYFFVNQPSESEIALQKRYADSLETVKQNQLKVQEQLAEAKLKSEDSLKNNILQDSSLRIQKFGSYADYVSADEQIYTLENDELEITFSNKGASVQQVKLKNYLTDSDDTVLLLDPKTKSNYFTFTENGKQVNSGDYFWKANYKPSERSLVFFIDQGEGSRIELNYRLEDKGYKLFQKVKTNGTHLSDVKYLWSTDLNLQERDVDVEKTKTTIYYKEPEETADYISETSMETVSMEKKMEWVSFKQQFFNATIHPVKPFLEKSSVTTSEAHASDNIKFVQAEMLLAPEEGNQQTFELNYLFAPNKYSLLKEQNIGLDKIIPLGWGIFGWINRFMIIPIFNFLKTYLSNYGIIILLLTLIIKTLLLPLVFKSYKSTAKMKLLKPEMDEIKEKYKDDMQKVQMENLALYKKAGVNPLGGCLPMLLQMPILVAVFQFVPSAFEFRQQSFLWADDLSIYDSIWTFGKVPVIDFLYGDHVSLFTLLMTISTLIYTRMNNEMSAGMNEQMKYISYIMPIMFLGFFNKYAAALTYYYFLSNIITFTQQFAIRRFVDEDKLKAQIHESKNRTGNDAKSAFQKKIEEMAKQRGMNAPNNKKK